MLSFRVARATKETRHGMAAGWTRLCHAQSDLLAKSLKEVPAAKCGAGCYNVLRSFKLLYIYIHIPNSISNLDACIAALRGASATESVARNPRVIIVSVILDDWN